MYLYYTECFTNCNCKFCTVKIKRLRHPCIGTQFRCCGVESTCSGAINIKPVVHKTGGWGGREMKTQEEEFGL